MEAYIIGGVRTAIGKFNGSLKPFDAMDLGAIVIKDLVKRTNINTKEINEVIIGNVIQAGLGQNPARRASILAGLPESVPAFTVNKVCGSGLKSITLAGQSVGCGEADVIIAGGMESMTNGPYITKALRWGQRMGNCELIDTVINDALWDSFYDYHMGMTAENIAEKFHITREEQDKFAALSQKKTEQSIKEGKFKNEIVPIVIKQKKEPDKSFDTDEHPRFGTTEASLAVLEPAFKKEGTVTAGNSSGINDGAAAVLVVSGRKMQEMNPPWAFRIVASQTIALNPAYMGLGPVDACRTLLKKTRCTINDLDLVEINEAFAAQSIQVNRELGWDLDKVNVLGGAIAIGHPVGASGTRILVTLMHEMLRRDASLGLASLCIGGGQGIAMLIERVR